MYCNCHTLFCVIVNTRPQYLFTAVLPLMTQYILGRCMKEMKFIGGRGYVVGENEIHYNTLILSPLYLSMTKNYC